MCVNAEKDERSVLLETLSAPYSFAFPRTLCVQTQTRGATVRSCRENGRREKQG